MRPKPTVLIILDGWGVASHYSGNAITSADPQFFNYLTSNFPTSVIQASGEAVGLSWNEVGNSEVGHLNIGAGKIVYQNLMKISKSIEENSFYENQVLISAFEHAKNNNSKIHFLGLLSSGGIHSYLSHLYALLEMAKKQNFTEVYIHLILDGRDSEYNEGINLVSRLINKLNNMQIGKIATLSGRFYAMDRDNNWERVEKAYSVMVSGKADRYSKDPISIINKSYQENNFDEEFIPTVIIDNNENPIAKIENSDSVIFFNFRSDRARQLTKAFSLPVFDKFNRKNYLDNLKFITFTEYEKNLPVEVAFQREEIKNPFAKVISDNKLTQLHIAETEKYAHITYFLNGGKEEPFLGEDNVIIPSPKIASYDKIPEMSAKLITKRVIKDVMADKYDFIAINFANLDMVGHTGNLKAAINAAKTVDKCLQEIVELVLIKNGAAIIIADHGNAEEMIDKQNAEIIKEHSNNPVPIIAVKNDFQGAQAGFLSPLKDKDKDKLSDLQPVGVLSDIAPTILKIMEIPKPPEMTGISLV
ncbi:2,3-bisphosphoglycerate-independent phosphoglycerate mutase [Candidatus Parcubacteria bacterium]|nr:2,3-bisphosphoglycerate-independent phosphoglycerate mutase [Candidatus Parcubacteria bacterium]